MSHPIPRVIRKTIETKKNITPLGALIFLTLFDPPGTKRMVDFFEAIKNFLFFRPEE